MELYDARLPVANILGAANEILQVLMLSNEAPNTPKISVSFKNKGKMCQTGLHLFCLKENCFPQLCKIICEMQTREKEGHLAFQSVNENNCGLQKTMLLWLEANTAVSSTTVNILSETVTDVNIVNDRSTVVELRTLMTVSNAIQCGKEILDLLQRIKLLNPKVQLLFSLCSLTSVEFELCDTNSISCGTFDVYCGPDLFLGKNTSHFTCQTMKAKCSRRFELKFQKKDNITGAAYLTCIACFVPICAAQKAHAGVDSLNDDEYPQKQDIRGHLKIQVYGPANLPFDMTVITKKLTLSPDSLLPWQRLGLRVKKSFSCSSYDMHCSAKITHRECVPSWANQCQHFCIVLAFTVNEKEDVTDDNILCRFYKHQESFRDLEQQVLNRAVYPTFQEAAWSCLEDLLSQDKRQPKSVKHKQNSMTDCQVNNSELFKKMIPEVANSLTDIFIRSTCMKFRSQVGALVPTSSRSSMSSHLEKSMWKVICKSRNMSENSVTSDQAILSPEESQVDDWDFSEDSLFSEEDSEVLSPDSLDLDWDNAQPASFCEDNTSKIDTTSESDKADCRVPEKHSSTNEDGSCRFQQSPSPSFDSYFSPEQEFDLWEMTGDFLNSTPTYACPSNTELLSPVFPQATIEYQHFHSVPCPEEHLSSVLNCGHEHVSSSKTSLDQSTEYLTNGSTESNEPKASYLDKMPRKRSSEYIDDDVSLAHNVSRSDDVTRTDDIIDSKKQRCQNYDSISVCSLSHQKVPTTFCFSEQDSCVKHRPSPKELDDNEETHLKHPDQVEDDTFSSCWFDEDDIAQWYAELDK